MLSDKIKQSYALIVVNVGEHREVLNEDVNFCRLHTSFAIPDML